VLGITLVGANSGLVPALIASLLASAFFNFFLAEPVLMFRMSTGEDLAPPVIFTACAVVSGLLAGRLKDKTFQLGRTNLQLESLLETSRMLQAALDVGAIQQARYSGPKMVSRSHSPARRLHPLPCILQEGSSAGTAFCEKGSMPGFVSTGAGPVSVHW
jgi:K+-sensing histidine kinase KdpD